VEKPRSIWAFVGIDYLSINRRNGGAFMTQTSRSDEPYFERKLKSEQKKFYEALENPANAAQVDICFERIVEVITEMTEEALRAKKIEKHFDRHILDSGCAILEHYVVKTKKPVIKLAYGIAAPFNPRDAEKFALELNKPGFAQALTALNKYFHQTYYKAVLEELLFCKNFYYFLKRDGYVRGSGFSRKYGEPSLAPNYDVLVEPTDQDIEVFFSRHRKRILDELIRRSAFELSQYENPAEHQETQWGMITYERLQKLEAALNETPAPENMNRSDQ
jgi:hypothetical protein